MEEKHDKSGKKIGKIMIIAGICILIIPLVFCEFDNTKPLIAKLGICVSRENGDCLKSIFYIDFLILGGAIALIGLWINKRKNRE